MGTPTPGPMGGRGTGSPGRPGRRSAAGGARSGGQPLIALGIVLALITGVIVLYLTSTSGPVAALQSTQVVVAARTLPTGTVLSADAAANMTAIADDFVVETMPVSNVPPNAYHFVSLQQLQHDLDKQIVLRDILAGDVLRSNDPRLMPLGSGPARSLANIHPDELPPGSVLFALHTSNNQGMQVGAQEGDHVDVLATLCVPAPKNPGGCQLAQTTLQDLLIYATPDSSTLLVVVSHQDALALKMLVENGKIDLVIRKPGDTTATATQAVDIQWIITHFGYTQP